MEDDKCILMAVRSNKFSTLKINKRQECERSEQYVNRIPGHLPCPAAPFLDILALPRPNGLQHNSQHDSQYQANHAVEPPILRGGTCHVQTGRGRARPWLYDCTIDAIVDDRRRRIDQGGCRGRDKHRGRRGLIGGHWERA
jgi:hypothetical protein